MTQQELADAADVDTKTIGNLERRGKWPIARNRAKIEKALGWPPGELERIAAEAPEEEEPELPTPEELDDLRRHALEVLGENAGPFLDALDAAVSGAPLRRRARGAAAARSSGRLRAAGPS
jgi:transcriptional regulator with XRE-family HTH domain